MCMAPPSHNMCMAPLAITVTCRWQQTLPFPKLSLMGKWHGLLSSQEVKYLVSQYNTVSLSQYNTVSLSQYNTVSLSQYNTVSLSQYNTVSLSQHNIVSLS